MIVADMGIMFISFFIAYYFRNNIHPLSPIKEYFWFLPEFIITFTIILYAFGMYRSFRTKRILCIIAILSKSAVINFMIFGTFTYLFHMVNISRILIVLTFILSVLLIALEKTVLLYFFRQLRKKGFNFRNILIVGTGERAQKLIKNIQQNPEFGLKIVGLIDKDANKKGEHILTHRVIGSLEDIPHILREMPIDQVMFIVPRSWLVDLEGPILYCEKMGISVSVAIDLFDLQFTKGTEGSLFGIPLISFEPTSDHVWQRVIKRLFDLFSSFIALIILTPFFILIAICIKLTSKGSIFFSQERVGLNGRKFILYKFRTMCEGAEEKLEDLQSLNEMDGPTFKITNDPRITPLGKFLRKFSIDELPQLYNVFKGDMSIVGPRPPINHEVEKYDHWQRRRLSMRPGITCLWQVEGRNKITSFDEWMKLDLKYIDNWSLGLDLNILLRTVPVVVFGIGAK